jgi:hypothetical protein
MLQVSNAIVSPYKVWQLYKWTDTFVQQLAGLLSWYMLDHVATYFSNFVSCHHCYLVCFWLQ